MTTIRKISTSLIDGDDSNNTTYSEIRPFGELAVYIDTDNNGGADKLELLMFDGVRTHLRSKVLAKGTFYGGDADSDHGRYGIENFDTIKLIPDAELHYNDGDYGNDQYIVIDPTFPNHIHVRAGGAIDNSNALLILGGELNNVGVSDAADQVVIYTNATNTWLFGSDGKLTAPGNLVIAGNTSIYETNVSLIQTANGLPLLSLSSGSNGGVSSLWIEDIGNAETSNIAAVYTNPTPGSKIVRIAVGQNGGAGGPNLWDFGTDGKLTAPGNLQVDGGKIILNTANNAYIESVDYGVNSANSAVNIFGGPYQKIKLRAGFGTEAIWTLGTDGSLTLPSAGKIVNNSNEWTFGTDGSTVFPENTLKGYIFTATNSVTNYLPQAAAFLYSDSPILSQISSIGGTWYIKGPGLVGWKQITAVQDNSGFALIVRIGSGITPLPDGSEFPAGGGNVYTISQYLELDLQVADKTWTFSENGNLTLPAGGDIVDSTGNSVLGGGTTGATWKTWTVAGQDSLIASGNDTIGIVAGTGIGISTNSTTKTITFSGTQNLEIDGGFASTIYTAEITIDGGGA